MNETSTSIVAEIKRWEVEEIENENELSPMEVGANEEHDKGKVEEVVHDKVTTDAGSGIDGVGIAGEEVSNIAKLQDEENDPINIWLAGWTTIVAREGSYQ